MCGYMLGMYGVGMYVVYKEVWGKGCGVGRCGGGIG